MHGTQVPNLFFSHGAKGTEWKPEGWPRDCSTHSLCRKSSADLCHTHVKTRRADRVASSLSSPRSRVSFVRALCWWHRASSTEGHSFAQKVHSPDNVMNQLGTMRNTARCGDVRCTHSNLVSRDALGLGVGADPPNSTPLHSALT